MAKRKSAAENDAEKSLDVLRKIRDNEGLKMEDRQRAALALLDRAPEDVTERRIQIDIPTIEMLWKKYGKK